MELNLPVTAFTALSSYSPIMTFMRSDMATIISVSYAQIERSVIIQELIERMEQIRPIAHDAVLENRKRAREKVSKGHLPTLLRGETTSS